MIQILETPRDGLQGIDNFIPTERKIEFIRQLLKCDFNTVEVGSLVSAKAIPQMADTVEILDKVDFSSTKSRIAVLVVNKLGGIKAMQYDFIDDLIFPFTISESFLKRNINKNFVQVEPCMDYLLNLCESKGKRLIPYLSMGFGNPYGDEWSMDILASWTEKFKNNGIKLLPVSDIMGEAKPELISRVFDFLIKEFPEIEFGLHLHSSPETATAKVDAAYKSGIRRFDTVLGGFGGCPMTGREMIGNLPLSTLTDYCDLKGIETGLNREMLSKAKLLAAFLLG